MVNSRIMVVEDEEKVQPANLLRTILLTTAVVCIVVPPIIILFDPANAIITLSIGIMTVIVILSLLALARQGHFQTVSILLSTILLISTALTNFSFGIVFNHSFTIYFVIVVIAGLLLGEYGAIIFGLASLVIAAVMFFAEIGGMRVHSPGHPAINFIMFGANLSLTMLLLRFAVRSIALGFERAKQNGQALISANQELTREIVERKRVEAALQKSHDELDRKVAERTSELTKSNMLLNQENTERKRAEEQLKASLREKEVLLKEIHHRVKNNMQIISSLLELQVDALQDEQVREPFKESQRRIRSMALIHEQLYRSHNLARIDFVEYVESLTNHLLRSYGKDARKVTLERDITPVFLSIDTAIPCGLIINELVSNALKHAFPDGRTGKIRVELAGLVKSEDWESAVKLFGQ